MTKIEIINETVEYYKNNPRAKFGLSCLYQTPEGYQCAHSRCLTEDARREVVSAPNNLNSSSADTIISELGGDECHQEQYRNHNSRFWNDIQIIHDHNEHWNGKEILQRSMMCGTGLNFDNVSENCAIALAVRDIFPKASVIYNKIYPDVNKLYLPNILISDIVNEFISLFDRLKHNPKERLNLPETSFIVDVPDSLIELIGIEEVTKILSKSKTLELV